MSLMFCLLVSVCGYRKGWRGPLQLHKTGYLVALRTGHAYSIVSIYGPTAVSTIVGKTVIDITAAVYCSVTPRT